ncbi:hypothetical protein VRRI112168_16775 [Vreelandella rituensis]|uniref:Uncharacterized protein n=1 Tax=Vreelandella rituensis TaxID=2282306 RepID=A0A368TR02_9GAMM|nr:hypothetical protein [Halomonas rituensis]RCV86657.1 hypothetical protein DU506_18050 [Halomonas rituensis]
MKDKLKFLGLFLVIGPMAAFYQNEAKGLGKRPIFDQINQERQSDQNKNDSAADKKDNSAAPNMGKYVDDTFSCLKTYKGPITDLSGYHKYDNFNLYDAGSKRVPVESRFDARDGIWHQRKFPDAPNGLPVKISSGSVNGGSLPTPVCFAGGTFIGTNDPKMSWREAKQRPRGRAILLVSDKSIIDGARIDNVGEDGVGLFVPRKHKAVTSYNRHTVRNTWFSNIFDDAIEETQMQTMLVEDTLFDGVMQAVATDPAGGSSDAYRKNLVTLNEVLIRTKPVPHPDKKRAPYGVYHGFGLKMRSATPHSWSIQKSVFAYDDREKPHGNGFASRFRDALSTTESCSNNVIAWMGDSVWPAKVLVERRAIKEIENLNKKFPGCFTILEGREARRFWEGARKNWINCHPQVGRIPKNVSPKLPNGDPSSDISKCDTNAYGGGGTNISATISLVP